MCPHEIAIVLIAWLIAFVSLVLALAILTIAYRLLGSDLRTEGWLREAVIAAFVSAARAGILAGVTAAIGHPRRAHFLLATVVSGLAYMITHFEDMERLEVSVIAATQLLLYVLGAFIFGII